MTMRQIVECVPNFSEGRRKDVVDEIVAAIVHEGVHLLDVQMDADHNRAVVSFVGDLAACERAAFAGISAASTRIDLNVQKGEHPRMGATDVVPFVPISGVTMDECVAAAQRLGQRVAAELEIPVYLYAEAAQVPERKSLPAIRKGEYEVIRDTIATDPARAPDYGPKRLGPAGATAVGARYPLIAYNVYLDTNRLEVAEACAKAVRESSGGLKNVQAKGFEIAERGIVQVSMNLLRYDLTPLHRVTEYVRREAERYGVGVRSSEVVGLLPQNALLDAAEWYLQIEGFRRDQVLDNRLGAPEPTEGATSLVPKAFLAAVASDAPTPGGGSVAALTGALGAALAAMVANLTVGREKYASVDHEMRAAREQASGLQRQLTELMSTDSAAFDEVMAAYKMPRATAAEADARREAIQAALRRAIEVPLETMRRSVEALRVSRTVAELGNANAVSDAGVSSYLAHAAVQGASLNVEINVMGLRDLEEGDRYRRECADLLREARAMAEDVDRQVRARIAG
jgi:glutamate formiminotransferase / formiminotetrahydrofolate cyclodeaminase